MKRFCVGFSFVIALMAALPAAAQAGDLYLTGVDPLLVRNAGGCKKVDAANIHCAIKHGQSTYVYFEAKRPKFEFCSISVARGPGERWHVNAFPCVAKRNGDHIYISVPRKR